MKTTTARVKYSVGLAFLFVFITVGTALIVSYPGDSCCDGCCSPVNKALRASVTVFTKGEDPKNICSGSGVVVQNGDYTFVWTNAHVVSNAVSVSYHINIEDDKIYKDSNVDDVFIQKDIFSNERKTGFQNHYAKIIRYCPDEDLALLMLYGKTNEFGSARFLGDGCCSPAPGVSLFHVGSPGGMMGEGFVSKGNMAAPGRNFDDTRNDLGENARSFDLVSIAFFPGSSGGGVYLENDGRCIGLISQMLSKGNIHAALVIPARRIRSFSETYECRWAFSSRYEVNETELAPKLIGRMYLSPKAFKEALDKTP